MRTIAGITVGQAPRVDMTGDLCAHLAPGLELVEYGALDHMTLADVERELAPDPGDEVLVSRMRDGSQATFSGTKVVPLVQQRIDEAEAAGAAPSSCCARWFSAASAHGAARISPARFLIASPAARRAIPKLAVMVPDARRSSRPMRGGRSRHGCPRGARIAVCRHRRRHPGRRDLRDSGCAFLCLDCMGFTTQMRDAARAASGLDVLLPRTLVASVISELMG